MLQLKNIVKTYSSGDSTVTALNDISIDFRDSEFVSILGQSGCGKTTLLNIIGGLDRYDSGEMIINGVPTKNYKERDWDTYRNHSIGFVFQSYNLIPHQSVLANVELALTISGISKRERRKRAIDVLNKVGLGDQLNKKPNQMSGGQMQRVAIARALINNPSILLADEPTGALDSETSIQVMDILRDIAKDRLVIMVTHNPELAERYSSRIVKLLDGKIIDDSNPYHAESAPNKTPTKQRKKSMSFMTALTLSLNNLMTKKARTLLTSFAGSIGIIGIALILALSTGINAYIAGIQEETLSSYPITITDETVDLSSLTLSMMQLSSENVQHPNDAVYSNPVFYQLMNAVNNDAVSNDLRAFKTYLEDEMDKDTSKTDLYKYVTAIVYGYDVNINAYATDINGDYVKTDIAALITSIMGNTSDGMTAAMMQGPAFQMWNQMLAPTEGDVLVSPMITDEYELLAGEWSQNPTDVMLILNQDNELSDLALYALGFKPMSEMTDIMMSISKGEQVSTQVQKWQYKAIIGRTFKLLLPSDYYQDTDNDGIYENISSDSDVLKTIIDNGQTLTISGIIKPKEDAKFAILTGSLGYTEALTKQIVDGIATSDVVKAQMADPEHDVTTGLPFNLDKDIDNDDKITAFKEYCSTLTDAQKRVLYGKMITALTDEEVAAQVDAILGQYETPEERNQALLEMYAESIGVMPEILGQYYGDIIANMSDAEIKDMLTAIIQQSNDPEKAIAEILATPTPEELEAMVAANVKATLDAYNELDPTGFMTITERQASEMLISEYYADVTAMDAAIFSASLTLLSDNEIHDILLNMAKLQYAATPMTVEQENAKIAKIFDEHITSMTNEELAAAYTQFAETSGSSYDNNMKVFGITDIDKPTSINIYTSSFANKDVIADIIQQYNDEAEESDQITYTDYVALIMSSVTDIVNAVSYVLIAFVSISLIVSSIMIGIITYISVLERTKEIGILRSIGASKRDISRVFNAETFIVGLAAGVIGIVATVLLCIPINAVIHSLTNIMELNAVLPIEGGLILVAISVVLTLIAGLIPSRIAAKKDPVVSLRTE